MVSANFTHSDPVTSEGKAADPKLNALAEQLAKTRKEYGDQNFDETMLPASGDPMDLFKEWYDNAVEMKMFEPNAMCLATCGKDGRPSNRYVLLKGFDKAGFVWYTNYESHKGQQIEDNPFGALTFWWGPLERSIRIEGKIEKVAQAESDEYFQVRPRGAEIAAWASDQSRPIDGQAALKTKYQEKEEEFKDLEKLQRPPFWGGYRLMPDMIEFWKGRRSRFHDRIQFKAQDGKWTYQRLQP